MYEDNFSAALTTTIDDVASSTMASSSSYDGGFYFQYAVVFIGVVGTAANALILYAMIASNEHKKQLLIFNQNVFDLCSSLLLVITYTVKLCRIRLIGTLGYWLCVIFESESIYGVSIHGSMINLLSITIERYITVVHPKQSKKLLRQWVIWSAAAFAWIAGSVYQMALVISTSDLIDGVCYGFALWKSETAALIHIFWNFGSFYVTVLFVFVFCYGKILVVVRRQARVMAVHSGPGSSISQTQLSHMQTNVIKTMILVCAFYVITWTPAYVYYLLLYFVSDITITAHSVTMFLGFFYVSANPFIYALKFDPVRRILVCLIPWKKSEQAGERVERPAPGTAPTRATHQRN